MKLLASLEHDAVLTDQGERPLLHPKRGAFFYSNFGPLGRPAECGEDGHVGTHVDCVIAPVPSSHHSSVKVEDALDLKTVECRNWAPIPWMRERRNDAQALFTFGAG